MVNYQPDILLRHLNGMIIEGFIYILDSAISCLVDQITHLTADIDLNRGELPNHLEVIVCVAILFYCRYLTDSIFSQRSSRNDLTLVSRNIPHGCSLSSTLTNLTIRVNRFDDCLVFFRKNLSD
jgi:hypothetical protein